MFLRSLKYFRIVISLLFFAATGFLFLDISHSVPTEYFVNILYLQFIPSLISFLHTPEAIATGFVVVLLLVLLFGRVYCSAICPLGTLQDIFIRLVSRFRKKKRIYKQPHNYLRYIILGITAITFIIEFNLILNLLDPYSIFGRTFTNLFRPVYISINNLLAGIFEAQDVFLFSNYEIHWATIDVLILPVLWLIMLVWLSVKYDRLYCNTLCPVGTLLGLISKVSLFKIKISSDKCTSCKLCEKSCKANCIDSKNQSVDETRCVNCFNCFRSCSQDGFVYAFSWKSDLKQDYTDSSKRQFFKATAILLTGLASLKLLGQNIVQTTKATLIPEKRGLPVTPPGSIGYDHFRTHCTGCHLCVSACPTNVLQPALTDYETLYPPKMDYVSGFCNFDCTVCGEICPSGAIKPLNQEAKNTEQIGIAYFIHDNCVVVTEGTDCGACSEHCPTKAVQMVPYGNLVIPKINPEICIGCGGCEFICPTRPYRAIYVVANMEHKKAKKPVQEKLKQEYNSEEEFPF